ncbi:MAG: hypothetical protein QMD44_07010 [Thermodesulfovibrionales bacterium]|jgi:hypothetical protein|nr:hypothetical protein [Thermodesulfovibrionales bacterium]
MQKRREHNNVITYQLPQPCDAKFLIVAAEDGKVVEINHFGSFKDAKQVFDEIASDHVCEPETVNKSGYYDVSIWRWTENRYVRLSYTDKQG